MSTLEESTRKTILEIQIFKNSTLLGYTLHIIKSAHILNAELDNF